MRRTAKRWTAEDVPDLAGRVAVVTGANSGIGLETARELARKGARTILACRSAERGQRALGDLGTELPQADLSVMLLDLGSLGSVERFARDFMQAHQRLDLLINNAGIMALPHSVTEDGFESQVGVNHLGHFALTARLSRLLMATPGARVVTVSSIAHRGGRIDPDNLLYEKGGYSPFGAYQRSKLANLLFTFELQRFFERTGVDTLALSSHPGLSTTNIGKHLPPRWYSMVSGPLISAFSQSAAAGALPTLRAAVDPHAEGGGFYGPSGIGGLRGHPVPVSSARRARSEHDARRLWEASERLTGYRFSQPSG